MDSSCYGLNLEKSQLETLHRQVSQVNTAFQTVSAYITPTKA